MKQYSLLFVVFVLNFSVAKSNAQTTDTASYKYKLTQTWYYNFSEDFGVKKDPAAAQKGDLITFKSDQTYQMILNGTTTTGAWNVSESTHFLTMSDSKTKQTRTIKILGLIKDQLELKWQAPDLTAEYKYFYAK